MIDSGCDRWPVVVALVLGCPPAWAEAGAPPPIAPPPSASQPGAPPPPTASYAPAPATVRITIVSAASTAAFPARLASWFGDRTEVTVAATASLAPGDVLGAQRPPGVYVWITVPAPHHARLYFVVVQPGVAEQRFLWREVELTQGLDEIGEERIAQVVHTSALALWEGSVSSPRAELEQQLEVPWTGPVADNGATTPPAGVQPPGSGPDATAAPGEASPTSPTARQPSESRHLPPDDDGRVGIVVRGEVGLGYALATRGEGGIAHGPELALELLASQGRWAGGGFVSAQYLVPTEVGQALQMTVAGGRLRVGGALQAPIADRLAVETVIHGGVDVVRSRATSTAAVQALGASSELLPAVGMRVGVRLPASGGVGVALAATLDVELLDTHYDLERRGQIRREIDPREVQPGFVVSGRWGARIGAERPAAQAYGFTELPGRGFEAAPQEVIDDLLRFRDAQERIDHPAWE